MDNAAELKKEIYKNSISITHRHILSIINTLLLNELALKDKKLIRILDAGCGDGALISFLFRYLPQLNRGVTFQIFGYDLKDHGVQHEDFGINLDNKLRKDWPGIEWDERIKLVHAEDPWPFGDEFFDIVISNQVLEHVWDHVQFFNQQHRVLNSKGFAIYLFPVKEVWFDGHVFLPFVHKLKTWDSKYKLIKLLSSLGLGIYKSKKKEYDNDLDFFSRIWADKLYHYCNYRRFSELADTAKKNHLCITNRFTFFYYRRKLQEFFGKEVGFLYKNKPASSFLFFFLKRLSGICLVMYKGEYSTYNTLKSFRTRDY